MKPAFWNFKDLALAIVMLIPALLIGAFIARFIPVPKPVQQVIAQLTMYIAWFAMLTFLFRITYDASMFHAFAWFNHGWIGTCVLGGVILAFAIAYLGVAMQAPVVDPPYKELLTDRRSLMLFSLAGVVFGPIAEELAFRGFLMPLFAKWMPPAAAAVATAVPFSLLHGPGYQWSWQHLVVLFLAGCVFGLVRWKLDSTLASSVTHSAYNLTFLAGYIANG